MKIGKFFGTNIVIKYSFFVFLPIFALICGIDVAVLYLLAIFTHELSHCLFGKFLSVETAEIDINFGGCMAIMPELNFFDCSTEIIVALAGPLYNIIIALLFSLLSQMYYRWYYPLMMFAQINFVLGVFNLIPALPFDGGRIVRGLMGYRFSRIKATKVAVVLSYIVAFCCLFAFFYFVAMGNMPIIFIIMCFIICLSSKSEMENAIKYNYRTFSNRTKLEKKARKINYIAIMEGESIAKAIPGFLMDSFNVVNIVDKNGHIKEVVTELELDDMLKN